MTENEWLACTRPIDMFQYLQDQSTQRKRRLFVCACGRQMWDLLFDERSRQAIEVGERYADGEATKHELVVAYLAAFSCFGSTCSYGASTGYQPARLAAGAAAMLRVFIQSDYRLSTQWHDEQWPAHVVLLRDVFANPFQRVSVLSFWLEWDSGRIPELARSIYNDRLLPSGLLNPDRFPALADALEEAGCRDGFILSHCRSEEPHVRGCWLIDLLLNNESTEEELITRENLKEIGHRLAQKHR
jgi:hypothetical protein